MADRVILNPAGVRDLLRSPGVERDLRERANRIAQAAGEGYEADSAIGSKRARATVWTATPEAMLIEATEHRLLRALDAGRGGGGAPAPQQLLSYTTRAGITRTATAAQVANWTRGSA
jgi:hypothetical protein